MRLLQASRTLIGWAFVAVAATCSAADRPRLVVVVSVDQLSQEYLQRFKHGFRDDDLFRSAAREGAVFDNCHHRHAFTITGPGHAVMLSGAYPNVHGVIANSWYDRAAGKAVNCVFDDEAAVIGAAGVDAGVSPRRLRVSTLGDVLKLATGGEAKVFSMAFKDRVAVLLGGHSADGAFWLHSGTANWLTSRYYRDDLPGYLRVINEGDLAEQAAGMAWELTYQREHYHEHRDDDSPLENPRYGMTASFPHQLPAADDPNYYRQMVSTPFANEFVLESAKQVMIHEQLGQDETPDLLAIGLSTNDYVGHAFGPYSLEVEDLTYRTDRELGKLMQFLDDHVGPDEWTLALTSDHGVAPIPEFAATRGLPAVRSPLGNIKDVRQQLEQTLVDELGEIDGKYVAWIDANQVFLARPTGVDMARARRVTRDFLLSLPPIVSAVTREQLLSAGEGRLFGMLQRAFHPQRSGDVLYVLRPYQFQGGGGTTHGSPWRYDTHVPLMLIGKGVGRVHNSQPTSPAALAPTLARLLDISQPPACVEEPLDVIAR